MKESLKSFFNFQSVRSDQERTSSRNWSGKNYPAHGSDLREAGKKGGTRLGPFHLKCPEPVLFGRPERTDGRPLKHMVMSICTPLPVLKIINKANKTRIIGFVHFSGAEFKDFTCLKENCLHEQSRQSLHK